MCVCSLNLFQLPKTYQQMLDVVCSNGNKKLNIHKICLAKVKHYTSKLYELDDFAHFSCVPLRKVKLRH